MSRKYIRQQIIQDFVYPNNDVPQYDVNDIVHDINNNSVDGLVNSFSTIFFNTTGLSINSNITWNLNSAEPWIRNSNTLQLYSVHVLAPGQDYFKPWRMVNAFSSPNITATTITQTVNIFINPSNVGLTGFTSGVYYFEIRFIGHRSIYPVCISLDLTPVTATPNPTSTPSGTGPTPTLTPTPTQSSTPTPTPTPTATGDSGELYVYAKYVDAPAALQYNINGGSETSIGTISTTGCTSVYTITGCTSGNTISFSGTLTESVAGSTSTCPATAGGCTYNHNYTTSTTVYITIDGNTIC